MTGEWTTIDKSGWGPGPWQDEPDKIHWIDPATDSDCLMVRHESHGHWCGYVGVTEGHPLFGRGYDWDEPDVDVHGGLTFAASCAESEDPSRGICHLPDPGRPDHVWWFGFDCAHGGDLAPGLAALLLAALLGGGMYAGTYGGTTYRDRRYVESEVRSLAQQLAVVS